VEIITLLYDLSNTLDSEKFTQRHEGREDHKEEKKKEEGIFVCYLCVKSTL
jgi:hypothetical protein